MNTTVTKQRVFEWKPKLFAIGLMAVISSFPMSLVVVYLYQHYALEINRYFLFYNGPSVYIGVTLSAVIVVVAVWFLLLKKWWLKLAGVVLLAASGLLFYLAVNAYTYMDETGVYEKPFFVWKHESYLWNDMEQATIILKEGRPHELEFVMSGGKKVLYPLKEDFTRVQLMEMFRTMGVEFETR